MAEPRVKPEVGLKELPPTPPEVKLEDALKDKWTERDGFWINHRTFNIPGGVVPQGVCRPMAEACLLEGKRIG